MKKVINTLFKKENKDNLIEGEAVDLIYRYETNENTAYDKIPTIYYDILLHETKEKIGSIDLRLKMDERMYYYGHVGYNIIKRFRGHNYSYYACLLLFSIAKEKYSLDELFITCNPENTASYKVLKKLGGELIEVVDIPVSHELYRLGDRTKCIFRYRIKI